VFEFHAQLELSCNSGTSFAIEIRVNGTLVRIAQVTRPTMAVPSLSKDSPSMIVVSSGGACRSCRAATT